MPIRRRRHDMELPKGIEPSSLDWQSSAVPKLRRKHNLLFDVEEFSEVLFRYVKMTVLIRSLGLLRKVVEPFPELLLKMIIIHSRTWRDGRESNPHSLALQASAIASSATVPLKTEDVFREPVL